MDLQGAGRHPAVLKLARSHVSLHDKGRVIAVPLDQVDHVLGGKQPGPFMFLLLGALVIVAGAAGFYLLEPALGIWWLWPALGLVLGGACIAGFFLQPSHGVRIVSGAGQVMVAVPKARGEEAAAFLRSVLAARTQYLEGVYPPEEA
jgi:hypothetical protein